jgi:hypothetical protein
MYFKSKKTSLLILGITSIICSRTMFVFFDDPEGPNLLIVFVAALVIFLVSLSAFVFRLSDLAKLGLAILIQILTIVLLILVEPFV